MANRGDDEHLATAMASGERAECKASRAGEDMEIGLLKKAWVDEERTWSKKTLIDRESTSSKEESRNCKDEDEDVESILRLLNNPALLSLYPLMVEAGGEHLSVYNQCKELRMMLGTYLRRRPWPLFEGILDRLEIEAEGDPDDPTQSP